ncbi:helix-turn-helix domain-containing protein [Streptomyces sp. NPDC020489]|uniref:helix-turn-helix domain-containing protein n=1 Tax=Streptomyces sp. NPDC020489 TaxID=3365077 RepID=UPI0037980767
MTTADELLAEDGAVVVPRSLASTTFAALVLYLTDRVRADGGALSPDARALLHALNHAAQQPSSASDTPTPAPATVVTSRVLGVAEAADVLGCNRSYVRRLCLAGRIPATRNRGGWVIEAAALDDYRHGRRHGEGEGAGEVREGRDRAAEQQERGEVGA